MWTRHRALWAPDLQSSPLGGPWYYMMTSGQVWGAHAFK